MKWNWMERLILLLSLALAVGGCASDGPPVDPQDESRSIVFGYFDMTDAPSSVEWVSIKRYGDKPVWYQLAVKDGLFFHVGIEPGAYQVDKFGKNPGFLSNTRYVYNFGTRGRNETARRIDKPGLYFLGAYKYVKHSTGWFEQGKFEMQPVDAPSEKELLTRLVKILESDKELQGYSRQLALAKRRLSQL
jgi:hypothetical protein